MGYKTKSFSILLLLAGSGVMAAPEIPKDLEYISPLPMTKRISAAQEDDVRSLSQYFTDNHFSALNSRFGMGDDFYQVDQIFMRHADNKVVYLLLNVAPKDRYQIGKVYAIDGNFLYHGVTPSGISFALYFDNFQEESAQKVSDLMESARGGAKLSILRYLIPTAVAGDHSYSYSESSGNSRSTRYGRGAYQDSQGLPVNCQGKSCESLGDGRQEIVEKIVAGIRNCTLDLVCGAFNNTVGIGIRAIGRVHQFFTDSRQFWKDTAFHFRNAMGAIGRLFKEGPFRIARESIEDFRAQSPSEKRRRICTFVGETAGMMATGYALGQINLVQKMGDSLNKNIFKHAGGGIWRRTGIQLTRNEITAIQGTIAGVMATNVKNAASGRKNKQACFRD